MTVKAASNLVPSEVWKVQGKLLKVGQAEAEWIMLRTNNFAFFTKRQVKVEG